eukprot:CAMPEP_0178551322 /NCGR_PEP_ID=MMETSP0697-20121206/6724_1 /TAXON_ID=265572 /ORGANISM="Extubocellulus spinifer, Strain CCMP396" /LENGTH=550 /DNA_ID=CAMNT_0020184169 /DNA_START=208 /DNA_END=1860 /DNA_ORIENTATION=-
MPFSSRKEISRRLKDIETSFSHILSPRRHSSPPPRGNDSPTALKSIMLPSKFANGGGHEGSSHHGSGNGNFRPMNVSQSYAASEEGPALNILPGSPPLFSLMRFVVGAITIGLVVGSIAAGVRDQPFQSGAVGVAGGSNIDDDAVGRYDDGDDAVGSHQHWTKANTIIDAEKAAAMEKEAEEDAKAAIERMGGKPIGYKSGDKVGTGDGKWKGMSDPLPDSPYPRLAWLLSFPNSGTSYTMKLIETATGHHVASNYGDHNLHKVTKLSEPFFDNEKVFNDMRQRGSIGPFIADAGGKKMTRTDSGYVITKTHCGGYCFKCAPKKYTLTDSEFILKCASGGWVYKDDFKSVEPITAKTVYDPKIIQRSVHLIRSPYDNMVSRYHLEHNHMERFDRQKDLAKYDRERAGFRKFCKDLNKQYDKEEQEFALAAKKNGNDKLKKALDIVKDVPCYEDLFKYINWHDHAFTATAKLKMPTLILHYNDYETDFDGTLETLLEFLEQPLASDFTKEFIEGKSYEEEFFTEDERKAVKKATKILASDELWKELSRYFS